MSALIKVKKKLARPASAAFEIPKSNDGGNALRAHFQHRRQASKEPNTVLVLSLVWKSDDKKKTTSTLLHTQSAKRCCYSRHSPTLTLSPLMIWCFGQTALFLFLLAQAAPAFLPTAHSVALRPLSPFRQAQYAQVFPLKPAPFCTLFAGFGSTNKSAIFLLFSSCLTLVLSSPPCPLLHLSSYLKLCGRSGRNCLLSPSVLLDYNGSPDTRFYRGTTRPMS